MFESYNESELTRAELEQNCRALREVNYRLISEEIAPLRGQVAELHNRMMAEREAKEQAYSFILESGLYEQFREYSRLKLYGDDAHKTCVEYLTHVSGVSMFDFKKPKT